MESNDFVIKYSEFYRKFLIDTADSIRLLAKIQIGYKDKYDKVRDFSKDPNAIQELIDRLDSEERNLLLTILLRGGTIGRKMSMLFEMLPNEQETFANEIEKLSKELDTLIEKTRKMDEKNGNKG